MVHVTNTHTIDISIGREFKKELFKQILLWGEAQWWPKKSLMRFVNESGTQVTRVGSVYLQRVRLLCGPRWHARVDTIDEEKSITRVFIDGMFQGYERVSIRESGPKSLNVSYYMDVSMKIVDYWLWKMLFQRLHDGMLRSILSALQEYMLACAGIKNGGINKEITT